MTLFRLVDGLQRRSARRRHLRLALVAASDPTNALLRETVRRLAPVLPLLTELGSRFVDAGHEIALVGGPVRDSFLGRVSPDLDLTTSAGPDQTETILAGWADAHWDCLLYTSPSPRD